MISEKIKMKMLDPSIFHIQLHLRLNLQVEPQALEAEFRSSQLVLLYQMGLAIH